MTVEILYGEVCNLYGDAGNIAYLRKCLPDAEIIETALQKRPAFSCKTPDLIYMGSMSEKMQELTIEKLTPYKKQLERLIEKGTAMLFTGNSMEILGSRIERDNGSCVEGLGIIDMVTEQQMFHRYNGLVLGVFEGIKIVGFRSQFSQIYPTSAQPFVSVLKGRGINTGEVYEGIRINNLFCTNLLGPFLIVNPLFTEYLIKTAGVWDFTLPFIEVSIQVYENRLKEFENKKTKFDIH